MVAKKTAKKGPQLNFEKALQELEKLVDKMEQGDLSLEQSLKDFERGIELARHCQQALKTAEQKVQLLVEKDGQIQLSSFEED